MNLMIQPKHDADIEELIDIIQQQNMEALFMVGFEDALVGYVTQYNLTLACYDYRQCIEVLRLHLDCDETEAREYFEFNIQGAYMGKNMPVILHIEEDLAG